MSAETGLFVPEDENITYFSTGHYVQKVSINDGYIEVEDPWLGDFIIADQFSYDYYTTTNAFRSQGVTQLLKSRESSTIPNLSDFTRFWGVSGQHPLVDRFGQEQGLTPNHIRAIHIGIESDDQGHFAYSHKLELAIQRWTGLQNYHEKVWPEIAELGGTADVLRKHNIRFSKDMKVKGYQIPEWAHSTTREDIDADRLQYIAAEGYLWFDNDHVDPAVRQKVKEALDPNNLEVTPDGKLAFKNAEHALVVSKLLMLFSTEHWNDPINRAHLHLGIHAVQSSIITRRIAGMDEIDNGETRDPVLYYHLIDKHFNDALKDDPKNRNDFLFLIANTLHNSGREERRKFLFYRLPQYCQFLLDDKAQNYPSAYLDPKRVEFGPRSSVVETNVVELTDEERQEMQAVKLPTIDHNADTLQYKAGSLKNRYIDPLVKVGNGYKRLSEVNSGYKNLLEEHQHLQELGMEVRFTFAPDYADVFREGMRQNDEDFEGLVNRNDMTADQRRRVLEAGANLAIQDGLKTGRLAFKGNAAEKFC